MNVQEMDIMNTLNRSRCSTQREISKASGYSLGKVNSSVQILRKDGYLDQEFCLTEKAQRLFDERRPKQAVILAAGAGMRMVPINTEQPKGLLEVGGEALIERIIRQLQEAGIADIRIVVGFMKERYEYLIDEYDVELIYNKDYASKGNLYSLARAADYLDNAYIVPCDIWCRENPFHRDELYSWYMVSTEEDEDSTVKVNRKRELRLVREEETGCRMIGIAYVCGDEAGVLKNRIREMLPSKGFWHSFWEDAAVSGNKMILYPNEVGREDVFEINTLEQLRDLDGNSNQLNSSAIGTILETLQCEAGDIHEIEALKKGMTNRSFRFRLGGRRYIMRIPGEGTDRMINRRQEYQVYQAIAGKDICDPVCYISPENGYKITEFLEDARVCDAYDPQDVQRCMDYLRGMHEKKMEVGHEFDIFREIEQYESYWEGEPSIYIDYKKTKEKVYELKRYIDSQEKERTLTHIDAVPDNFLFVNDRIYLIDWEYAGMQDPHVDIAMYAIYAMYDREHVEQLIDAYFHNACPENVRIKIYCYIAACGLLWSNWCEYKRMCGVEFGEYSLRQYRYAKEYYRIVADCL